MFKIRRATPDDLSEILKVFKEAIETLASKDYEPEQVAAWTASVNNTSRWLTAIEEQYFLLVLANDIIAGFGSLQNGNYLDFLFVNKDYTGKGIATRLLSELEQETLRKGKMKISAYVSKTALGFFQKKGFTLIRENDVKRGNVRIDNYYMEKRMNTNQ